MKEAAEILEEAARLVGEVREGSYGSAQEGFDRVAALWNAWLSIRPDPALPLTAEDVALMMSLLKMARSLGGPETRDNYVDAAGYAALGGAVK